MSWMTFVQSTQKICEVCSSCDIIAMRSGHPVVEAASMCEERWKGRFPFKT